MKAITTACPRSTLASSRLCAAVLWSWLLLQPVSVTAAELGLGTRTPLIGTGALADRTVAQRVQSYGHVCSFETVGRSTGFPFELHHIRATFASIQDSLKSFCDVVIVLFAILVIVSVIISAVAADQSTGLYSLASYPGLLHHTQCCWYWRSRCVCCTRRSRPHARPRLKKGQLQQQQ